MNDSLSVQPVHPVKAFRLKNFMGFTDTNWIDLKPVTLLFGRNSSGKSALIRALRFLSQNIDLSGGDGFLYFAREGGVDLGKYQDVSFNHRIDLPLTIGFKVWLSEELRYVSEYPLESEDASIQITFSFDPTSQKLKLYSFSLYEGGEETDQSIIFATQRLQDKPASGQFSEPYHGVYWSLYSSLFNLDLEFEQSLWKHAQPALENSFVPVITIPGAVADPNVDRSEYEGRGDDFKFVTRLIGHLKKHIEAFMHSITYIGPIRDEPKRFYYVPQQVTSQVGNKGQFSVGRILDQTSIEQIQNYIEPINQWLEESSLKCKLLVSQVSRDGSLYSVVVQEHSGFRANLQNVGFGISQLLPVLVESMISTKQRLIIIEQPELHLHPQAQAELGDLFARMTTQGTRFLLETHSEHLMLRFRRRIAETTLANLEGRQRNGMIHSGEFALLFVNRGNTGNSEVQPIFVNHYGQLVDPPPEFRKFFEDDYVEVSELSRVNSAILFLEEEIHEARRRF